MLRKYYENDTLSTQHRPIQKVATCQIFICQIEVNVANEPLKV